MCKESLGQFGPGAWGCVLSISSSKVSGLILAALTAWSLAVPAQAAAPTTEPDQMTQQAYKLFEIGRLQAAIDAESEAIEHNPKDWLPLAMRSYYFWQQGCTQDAIMDGQKAVELSGDNVKALTNLAVMHQTIGELGPASDLFARAAKCDANDWLPPLGQARCYLADGGNENEAGLGILKEMVRAEGKNFQWYSKVGELLLSLKKNEMAAEAAAKSVRAASTKEEKALAQKQLVLSLLRSEKVELARPYEKQILSDSHLCEPELITRTASQLIPAGDTASAKKLLQVIQPNLKDPLHSDVYYRLGRIFEEKAACLPVENIKAADWIGLAEKSYSQAVALAAGESRFHSALASVFCKQNRPAAAMQELNTARKLDSTDQLLPVLATNLEAQTTKEADKKTIRLTEVRFNYNAAACGCKSSKIAQAFKGIDGVLFAATKTNEGGIIIDAGVTPVADIFAKCTAQLATPKNKQAVKFEVLYQKPIADTRDALKLAQDLFEPSPVAFFYELTPVEPVLPIALEKLSDKTRVSSKTATTR